MQAFSGTLHYPPYAEQEPFLCLSAGDRLNSSSQFLAFWTWTVPLEKGQQRSVAYLSSTVDKSTLQLLGSTHRTLDSESNRRQVPHNESGHDEKQQKQPGFNIKFKTEEPNITLELQLQLAIEKKKTHVCVDVSLQRKDYTNQSGFFSSFPIFVANDAPAGIPFDGVVMAFLEGIDLGKTIHLWGLLPGTTRFQETVCVVESFQPCLDDEDGHLAFQWGAKQLSGTLKFSENSSGLTLIVTTAGIQSEESRTAQFNRTQLWHMTPLSLATTNLQEQGDGLPITTIVNDLKPPEVVRVKIFDSEKHIVERVIMDMISILPITDNFTKAIKAGGYARKGWEYFSKFLSAGKIINGYITLTEDVDTGLFPEDSVRRKPNRTDKLAPNNHVVVERFSTDPVRGITIEVFEKTRADNQTWLLSTVVKYGDTHGWSRKVIPLTLRTPRRGIRLKHMKPSGSWIHHDKYPENDIVGCVYALAPGQGDDLLPAVYFYPDVFKSSTVENQKIMGYDKSFDSYLILSEIGDGSDRIQILRPGGWDGRLLIRLKDVVIRSPNSEGEDLGTQDSEYGSSKQTGVVTLIKEDLVDKVRPPVAYCWRDSHFVFRLDKCPTSNITTDYQYYMERNSGSYSYLILDEWVTVPGV